MLYVKTLIKWYMPLSQLIGYLIKYGLPGKFYPIEMVPNWGRRDGTEAGHLSCMWPTGEGLGSFPGLPYGPQPAREDF